MELHPVSRTPVSSSAAGLDSESSEDDEESKWERKPRRESHQTYSFWLVAIGGVYLLYRTMGCIYHYWFYIWSILISFSFRTNSLLGIVTTIMGISMLNLRLWWIPFVWSWRVFFRICVFVYIHIYILKLDQDGFYMNNWSKSRCVLYEKLIKIVRFSTCALIKFGSMLIFRVKNCETCWCRQLIGGFCRYLVGLSFTVIEFDPLPHVHGIYISYLLLYTLCQFNHFHGIYIFLLLDLSTDQL